jgi:hypothetical protein
MTTEVSHLLTKIHDAGLAAEAWPEALKALTDALGVGGAACIVFNKRTEGVDWVCFSGLSSALESKYANLYAHLDPFSPLLNVAPGWQKLSECLSASALARSEWYNDFVLACGVRDMIGTCLVDTPSHTAVFGLHQQIGRGFGSKTMPILHDLTAALNETTLRHIEGLFAAGRDDIGTEMPTEGARYYFHVTPLTHGGRYPDQTGKVFATREDAIAQASILAAELRVDKGWEGFCIFVTDQDGRTVIRIPVFS